MTEDATIALSKVKESVLLLLFFVLFAAWGIRIQIADPPHMTDNVAYLFLAVLLLGSTGVIVGWMYVYSRFTSIILQFNAVWLLSIGLALMTLSKIQYELDPLYLLYLAGYLMTFNISYQAGRYAANYSITSYPARDEKYVRAVLNSTSFTVLYVIIFLICVAGYVYQMSAVGLIPILSAVDTGFYANRAGFLSIIHYFATSLGPLAGVAVAFTLTLRRRFLYLLISIIGFLLTFSLLSKNVLLLFGIFFIYTFDYLVGLKRKHVLWIVIFGVAVFFGSSFIRLGSHQYMKVYSRIESDNLSVVLHWLNTYFGINITHLNTYFRLNLDPTLGYHFTGSIWSFLFLRNSAREIFAANIPVVYNGLGGGVNVTPLFFSYLLDFGSLGALAMLPIGFLSGYVYLKHSTRYSYTSTILASACSFALMFSVFGDFVNRIMVHIAVLFLCIPYIFAVALRKWFVFKMRVTQ